MHNASFSEHLASWDRIANGVSSRAAEVRALTLSQREEPVQARNTRLRCSLWGQYGRESPQLHVFGMRPYPCSRARRAAVAVIRGESLPNAVSGPAPPPPAPEVKGEPSPSVREATIGGRLPSVWRCHDEREKPRSLGEALPSRKSTIKWLNFNHRVVDFHGYLTHCLPYPYT